MKTKFILIFILLIGLFFIAPQQKVHAQNADMDASETVNDNVSLPLSATSAQAGTTQNGFYTWQFNMQNNAQTDVTNPKITVNSGYDPSLFEGISSFPFTYTKPSLTPGEAFSTNWLTPNDTFTSTPPASYATPVTFTLGYDSTRTVNTDTIPVGGTQQTVTITLTPIDSEYLASEKSFHVLLNSNVPGVTVASVTDPANLDQGEQVSGASNAATLWQWDLSGNQLNKQYTFIAVLNVPNQYSLAYKYLPTVMVDGDWKAQKQEASGSTITITDPSLDGSHPGSGAVTFSVDETNHTWLYGQQLGRIVVYQGTQDPGQQEQLTVPILIKPGSDQPAAINPKSQGTIPVAILTTDTFDATTVDPTTVVFGPMGPKPSATQSSLEDVNGDGKLDMVLHFPNVSPCGIGSMSLDGQTKFGQQIHGSALVTTVGCQ